MSLLSALLGTIVPTLLPKRWTTVAAAVLFFVFGARMLQEGLEMEAGEKGREKMEEEMREVQKEVEEAENEVGGGGGDGPIYAMADLEEGRMSPAREGATSAPLPPSGRSRRGDMKMPSRAQAVAGLTDGAKNLCNLFFSPIFVQAFVLTFLAEWGDRSQITTIALAAAHVSFHAGIYRRISADTSRAERVDCHIWHHIGSFLLHHARRAQWALDLSAHFGQAW